MKILCIGSINVDKTYRVDHIPLRGETISSKDLRQTWGGKGLNQCVALAKSCDEVYLAGIINEKESGLRDFLKSNNIHDEFLHVLKDQPTGHAIINVGSDGQNSIVIYSGANKTFTEDYVDSVISRFAPGDLLLLQNEINGLDFILRKAHQAGMKIAMNPSPFERELLDLPLDLVDLLLVNEVEGYQLTGCKEPEDIIRKTREMFPHMEVLLTLGSEGSVFAVGDTVLHQPIYRVPVVDTTAAGDTFTGYFLSALAAGMPAQESLDRAARASAIAVSRSGAAISIPSLEEVMNMDTAVSV